MLLFERLDDPKTLSFGMSNGFYNPLLRLKKLRDIDLSVKKFTLEKFPLRLPKLSDPLIVVSLKIPSILKLFELL